MVSRFRSGKFFALLLAVAMIFAAFPASIMADTRGDVQTDLQKVKEYFAPYNNSSNPLLIQYGTGEGQYTNLKKFIAGKAAEATGREAKDIGVSYAFAMGTVASGTPLEYSIVDKETGDLKQDYNEENKNIMAISIVVDIEGEKSEKFNCQFKVEPKPYTDREKLDLEAGAITWDLIRGNTANRDENSVITNLGLPSSYGPPKPFPNKAFVFNNDEGIDVEWSCTYTGEGEDPGALVFDPVKRTTKVTRPDVDSADAPYDMKCTLKSKKDSALTKEVVLHLKVLKFQKVVQKFEVTPQTAVLTLKDDYYGKDVNPNHETKNGDERLWDLHYNGTDKAQSYSYVCAEEGYITKKGDIYLRPGVEPETETINLIKSSEKDNDLADFGMTNPKMNAASVVTPVEKLETSKLNYNLKVGALDTITLQPSAYLEDATVEMSYFSDAANAAADNYSQKTVTSRGITCYLKTDGSDTVIKVKVTAPESSTLTEKTKEYTLTVQRDPNRSTPLETLNVYDVGYDNGGSENNLCIYPEGKFDIEADKGGLAEEYTVSVNNDANSAKLKAKPVDNDKIESVSFNGDELTGSSSYSFEVTGLKTGNNKNVLSVKTKDGKTFDYNINIRKKSKIDIDDFEVSNGKPMDQRSAWIRYYTFSSKDDGYKIKFNVDQELAITVDGKDAEYKSGDWIPMKSLDGKMNISRINFIKKVTEDGKTYEEAQTYLFSGKGRVPGSPSAVDTYIPAPGQFVNEEVYGNPEMTLGIGMRMVTLGACGGSIVYKFDEPISDDPDNPYGIDFIVYGNAFRNADGSSAEGAAEAAAVKVSEDGSTWYELAGSCYFDKMNKGKTTITYTNPDKNFGSAKDVSYTTDTGLNGVIAANSYHKQSYYPNPAIYNKYNKGVGKNDSYNAESVSFTCESFFNEKIVPRFGYGDAHSNDDVKIYNKAENPYVEKHNVLTNGDGMDLAWAVDKNGKHVDLSGKKISFVKVYNPILLDQGGMGEVSPEISGVCAVKKSNSDVGKTDDLKKLVINGKELPLEAGKYEYETDMKGSSLLRVLATAKEADTNILVNNMWTKSDEETGRFEPGSTVRLVVQKGEKTPKQYFVKIKNKGSLDTSKELETVKIDPPNKVLNEDGDGIYSADVSNNISKLTLTVKPVFDGAEVKVDGTPITASTAWRVRDLKLKEGKNEFVVTVSTPKSPKEKIYKIVINRAKASSGVKLSRGAISAVTMNTGKRAITVSVRKANNAGRYRVAYRALGSKKWSYKWANSKRKAVIKNMRTGKCYQFMAANYAEKDGKRMRGSWSVPRYRLFAATKVIRLKSGKKKITVNIRRVKSATGYQILISANKSMKNARIKTVKGNKNVKLTIKGLKKRKTYYVKVRPIKKSGKKTYIGILTVRKHAKVS